MGVWEVVPRAVVKERGMKVVKVRWLDVDKGTGDGGICQCPIEDVSFGVTFFD